MEVSAHIYSYLTEERRVPFRNQKVTYWEVRAGSVDSLQLNDHLKAISRQMCVCVCVCVCVN